MDEPQKAERQTQMRRLQSEIFVFEGDRSRLERKREEVDMEIKRLKNSIARLKVELEEKEHSFATLERQIESVNEEIGRLKKKMNAL